MMVLSVLLLLIIALLALSVPIGVSIGLGTLVSCYLSDLPFGFYCQRMFSLFDSFPLTAIPFFILAGSIMQHGSLANSLLGLCRACVGHLRGGLAHISILTCLFYGALCGSAAATVAAIGATLIPAMVKEGYPKSFATALNVASGNLGVMIPPSVPLILIGAFGGVSITKLFIAAIGPGLMFAALFMLVTAFLVKKNGYGIMHEKMPAKERLHLFWEAKWAMGVPFIVLGGIYGGIFTPTEAGAMAVFYAIIVETFITKSMSWKLLKKCFDDTLLTQGVIFLVMVTAFAMGGLLQYYSLETALMEWMQSIAPSAALWMGLMTLVLIVIGMFVDGAAITLIFTPLLIPLAKSYGIDPVHFGVFMLVAMCVGYVTPPVAPVLYVGCSISQIGVMEVTKAILPYLLAMVVGVLIVAYVPALSLMFL